jgi:prenyltransferase beta subunit
MVSSMVEEKSDIFDLGQEVSRSLLNVLVYIKGRFKELSQDTSENIGGWSQFLEEETSNPTVTGTACALSAIILCGENKKSEMVSSARNFILQYARTDGGWTKPSLQPYLSMVLTTCQALGALLDADQPPTSNPVRKAINYLIDAQNTDGGWGFVSKDEVSDVTTTAYAMRSLVRVAMYYPVDESVERGKKWLFSVRNPDDSWGRKKNAKGTLAHSSHAAEALLLSGVDKNLLLGTKDWLLANYLDDGQFIDHFLVRLPGKEKERVTWSHMSCERNVIALLQLGVDISRKEIVESINKILECQMNNTYGCIELASTPGASWAISEAVIALKMFQNFLQYQGMSLALMQDISVLKDEIKGLRNRILELDERLENRTFKSRIKKGIEFFRRPIPLLSLFTIILVAIYMFLRNSLVDSDISDIFMGFLGIIGFALSIYQIYLDGKASDKK